MADTTVLDPIAKNPQPETVRPISLGSFDDLFTDKEQKELKALKNMVNRDNVLRNRVGFPEDDLPPQPKTQESQATISDILDTTSELHGAVTELAGEKVGEAFSYSMDQIKKGTKVMWRGLADQLSFSMRQVSGASEPAEHQEEVVHDSGHAVAETGVMAFFHEGERQVGLPVAESPQTEQHHNGEHSNELSADGNKIAALMQELAHLAHKRNTAPMETARAEVGIIDNKEENQLMGIKNLDFTAAEKNNVASAFALMMGKLAQLEERKMEDNLDTGGGSLRQKDLEMGQRMGNAIQNPEDTTKINVG